MMPHMGHAELMVFAMTAGAYVDIGQNTKMKTRKQSLIGLYLIYIALALDLRLQAFTPSYQL